MSDAREILDRVDRLRRTANAAESVRTAIRLGSKPRLVTRHLFGAHETTLDVHETSAIYEALADTVEEGQR